MLKINEIIFKALVNTEPLDLRVESVIKQDKKEHHQWYNLQLL